MKAIKRLIVCCVILSLVCLPVLAENRSQPSSGMDSEADSDYAQGEADGREDAKGKGVWILSGLLLGPIGIILPWIFTPEVPGGNFIGKTPDYIEGYQDGYRSRAKVGNFLYSLLGFGITAGIVVTAGFTVLVFQAAEGAATSASACVDTCAAPVLNCSGLDLGCSEPTCSGLDLGCSDPGCSQPDITCGR